MKKIMKTVIPNLFRNLKIKEILKQVQDDRQHKPAFTLAEVLITLTIIGVIAAITIPNLMKKWEDAHTVSAVKEMYSVLDNALKQLYREEGTPDEWGLPGTNANPIEENNTAFMEKLSHYLKVRHFCGSSKSGQCSSPTYKYVNGNAGGGNATVGGNRILLQNGMKAGLITWNGATSQYGIIKVDINGDKGPNRYGYDLFAYPFDNRGLAMKRPSGVWDSNNQGYSFAKNYCSIFSTPGNGASSHTNSCVSWIMRKGNVDYKYRDVRSEWNW